MRIKPTTMGKNISLAIFLILILTGAIGLNRFFSRYANENRILKQVISRLEADSRVAEVLVTNVSFDEKTGKESTTIKFLEFNTKGEPAEPKYFTFPGNIIQFQSLVIRFTDPNIIKNDSLRGKSIYLFWKVFMLDGPNTKEFDITKINTVPEGYKCQDNNNPFEEALWRKFWAYALNPEAAKEGGIKNAQIEAPGTLFIPGTIYTIKIEHDGGLRIDTQKLPAILRGESIPNT